MTDRCVTRDQNEETELQRMLNSALEQEAQADQMTVTPAVIAQELAAIIARASADSPVERPPRLNGDNCTVVMIDIAEFNATVPTAGDRRLIQKMSLTMTRDAFADAGIPWADCHHRDRGDWLLLVVPPTIPPATVIRALNRLAAELTAHNRRSAPAVQIRLKVALHVGPVATTDHWGLTGDALVLAARLLEAAPLKRSMAKLRAPLGVMASSAMYDTVIKDLNVAGYRQVRCKVKESRLVAWMHLTGHALPPA